MWQILPRLYLGTKEDSENLEFLKRHGITHVVNCAAELPCQFMDTFEYLHLSLKDPDDRLGAKLGETLAFVDHGREQASVLVHCTGGISRSPSIILAYLCHTGLELSAAVQVMCGAVQTRPNSVFLRQVCDYFAIDLPTDMLTELSRKLAAEIE
jgi:protein-tyrosine phosphatase